MDELFSLAERCAIVTGAASGIGRATAQRLARAGARVAAFDLDEVAWDETGILAHHVVCDVSREDEIASAIADTARRLGGVDILVNNAGTFSSEPVEQMSRTSIGRNMAVNFEGVVWGIKYGAAAMRGGGAIVNVASHAGLRGVPNYGAYAASKAAVIAYTKTAALELAAQKIRVNCVCPGTVGTPMSEGEDGRVEVLTASLLQPLGRIARPEEIAAAIHFLVSDDCGFVTGHALAIDGGKTAGPAPKVLEILSEYVLSATQR
jgi:NAD(P)-dependent dehydrogenase (short-subunit alcohol dehydrogenase family)